ncbi:Aminoacyl-tRNA synthetase, class 1a, anticodon-binding [Artemisia annua]|uniref:Aminoacyl-tRNA synthetase, class 1a, anticodon-binding n=1 Tax=Artemisia annua TaxID=35608 RepID=A0A2U1M2H5_ARTAN|nr:Aminoacyl-tRNA synthetase, class 1a, anticodon-binding [Artemisia annua]
MKVGYKPLFHAEMFWFRFPHLTYGSMSFLLRLTTGGQVRENDIVDSSKFRYVTQGGVRKDSKNSIYGLFGVSVCVLGKRLGKSMRVVIEAVKAMSKEDIWSFEEAWEITIAGHDHSPDSGELVPKLSLKIYIILLYIQQELMNSNA